MWFLRAGTAKCLGPFPCLGTHHHLLSRSREVQVGTLSFLPLRPIKVGGNLVLGTRWAWLFIQVNSSFALSTDRVVVPDFTLLFHWILESFAPPRALYSPPHPPPHHHHTHTSIQRYSLSASFLIPSSPGRKSFQKQIH